MEISDETLVRQAVTLKDVSAFEQLVHRHQVRMLHLQRRFVRDHALAEDLAQETFLRAWDKLDTFRGTGSFAAWLTRLGYNIFLQHRRKMSNATKAEQPYPDDAEGDANATTEAMATPGPHDELPDLPKLLAVLPEAEQLVLVLSYGQGLSVTEISDVLDVPSGTIKSQIHRAKEKIRAHFKIEAAA
ncbi:MAG: sigma-70 family RNA polymerase sigma factor [Gammaproteobacteria bacterium]|nr:sigma-70 family RNA polymerase sigma factor [Gammaproteobacteria bacterium]